MNERHQEHLKTRSLTRYSTSPLPTKWGLFQVYVYRTARGEEHMAICRGDLEGAEEVLTRVHSACFTGEVLGSLKCDCKSQLNFALREVQEEGLGVILYLFQEGRGIGLGDKIQAYSLQENGLDTVDANTHLGFEEDEREYSNAVEMLLDLKVRSVRLMTNNPLKIQALNAAGIKVVQRIQIEVGRNAVNAEYLNTKRERMGHILSKEVSVKGTQTEEGSTERGRAGRDSLQTKQRGERESRD